MQRLGGPGKSNGNEREREFEHGAGRIGRLWVALLLPTLRVATLGTMPLYVEHLHGGVALEASDSTTGIVTKSPHNAFY